jgi:hypothetical protein
MREMYRRSGFDGPLLEVWIGNAIGMDDVGRPFAQFRKRPLATEFGNDPQPCPCRRNGNAIGRCVGFEQQGKFVARVRECRNQPVEVDLTPPTKRANELYTAIFINLPSEQRQNRG